MKTHIEFHQERRDYDVSVDGHALASYETYFEAEACANDARYRDLHCCAYPCRSLLAPMAALDAEDVVRQYRGFKADDTDTRSLPLDRAVEWLALGWRYRAQSDAWERNPATRQVFLFLYRGLAAEITWNGGTVTRCTLARLWQQAHTDIVGTTPDVDSADMLAVRPRQLVLVAATYADVHQQQLSYDLTHGHLTFI